MRGEFVAEGLESVADFVHLLLHSFIAFPGAFSAAEPHPVLIVVDEYLFVCFHRLQKPYADTLVPINDEMSLRTGWTSMIDMACQCVE